MGLYLNSKKPASLYQDEAESVYYVDKTAMLDELVLSLEGKETDADNREAAGRGYKYICVTRPRRFGKTMAASMAASYFGKGRSMASVFDRLEVSSRKWYKRHLNSHNVIYIPFNEMPRDCVSYGQYIDRIQSRLLSDLAREFPNTEISQEDAVWDALNTVFELEPDVRFIFVLDEWDYIFHRNFVTEKDKAAFIDFLSNLLKNQPYMELVYMTGILPIAKYSSGSELNMFCEYTMAGEERFSRYFGFTDAEVDQIYEKYQRVCKEPKITRDELRRWYDGYQTCSGERVYNPRSVVLSLLNNHVGNYWTSSGPYDEIFFYINKNVDDVRDDLALMISNTPVPAKIREYAATSMNLTTRDEIFSAMVVYGFLSYDNGCVSIPNKELQDKFGDMLLKEPSLGYIYNLAKDSQKMLEATKSADTAVMEQILEQVHDRETPKRMYNSEAELASIVRLVYFSARDFYEIRREDDTGKGYVDFIFYPMTNFQDDCIILELKVDKTAQKALRQIKDRNYAARFLPGIGEAPRYTGRILAVGIAYDRRTKKHECCVEVLRSACDFRG